MVQLTRACPTLFLLSRLPTGLRGRQRRNVHRLTRPVWIMARPTVAVGDPVLKGSAILWDNLTGLSTTDAHVILQCSTAAGALDPEMQGVALGVGSADADIVWLWTARIVTISYPPSPRPSWLAKIASWSFTIAPGSPTLDLAVLQVQGPLNGGGPSKPLNEMFAGCSPTMVSTRYRSATPALRRLG